MSQLNVNIIKNEAGTAGPTLSGDVTITGSINTSGIITATSFSGSGANLTGVGLGTTGSINTSGIITATTLTIGAGTTALPSISPTGDSNTGIFFPSADTIAFSEGGTEALRVDSSGDLRFNSGYGSVATAYGCRAWVNFNGTGTVAIRASGNVSSITDNGTGEYTVNFTTAMPDANYAVGGCCEIGGVVTEVFAPIVYNTASIRVVTQNAAVETDATIVNVIIFR